MSVQHTPWLGDRGPQPLLSGITRADVMKDLESHGGTEVRPAPAGPGRRMVGRRRELQATLLALRVVSAISPRAAEPFAAHLWFTPWSAPAGPEAQRREADWLAGTEPLSVPFEGRALAGFAAGEGRAVLLVHGWGDRAARLGAFVQPLVAGGHRVVGVDLPGHGDDGPRETNAFEEARAVRAAAEQVGARAVVAHSFGGVATAVALRDGLDVEAVALLGSPVRLEQAVDRFAVQFRLPARAVAAVRSAITRRFGAGVWEALAIDAIAPGVPALVVHDREDPQVPLADGQALAAAWPGAELVVTEGLGHRRILRDPDVVGRVAAFLTP